MTARGGIGSHRELVTPLTDGAGSRY